ncbi:MAG: hypothetical protein R3C11_26615 [Planctomycetaceae bacterium]
MIGHRFLFRFGARSLLGWGLLWLALFATEVAQAESDLPTHDNYTLLFFESEHPWFIRLQVAIDQEAPSRMREGLLGKLFDQTDTNRNNELEPDELQKFRGAESMHLILQKYQESNSNPLPRDQYLKLMEPSLGIPFGLQLESARVSDLPDLFTKLDLNQNKILDPGEWNSALHLLQKYDFDDDETLNLVEVMPLLRPLNLTSNRAQRTTAGQSAGLFELIDPKQPREQLAHQLLSQYDGTHGEEQDGHLSQTELGWTTPEMLAPYDQNGDQLLNRSEIFQLLSNPPAQRVWRMRMPVQKKLIIRFWETDDEKEEWKYPRSATSRSTVQVGSWEISIRIHNPRPQFSDALSFYQLQFLQLDGDKNGVLSTEEARGLANLATVETLDTNQDEEVTREELTAYINQEAALAQCQLLMSVDKQSQSLFRLLDADSDRRLEPRELLNTAQKLKSFDSDQDGKLTESEMKTVYQLSFQLQPPSLFNDDLGLNQADRIGPILSPTTAGPEWFRQMDRNLDGDLTRREFLGTGELFQQLDVNQDGLLSPAEAEPKSTE